MIAKLREFEDEIAPVAKDIKEYIDNSYTKDLKKKKGMSSVVSDLYTTFFEDIRKARRLSGGEGK